MVLAKLIINFALPSMIFGNLAVVKISFAYFKFPGIVKVIELCSLVLAYFAGKAFRFSRDKIGALVLVWLLLEI
ncbi:MAG TPA: hypothetical protein DD381_00015 [Lentisphaeria bacterium]|nr:MAG: hypothetical protein A2X47_12825 [Lentisphaerae bacterium GWF2_38_69]HBM14727.1 hypothetical protein [Lentisphaeria bacterium]